MRLTDRSGQDLHILQPGDDGGLNAEPREGTAPREGGMEKAPREGGMEDARGGIENARGALEQDMGREVADYITSNRSLFNDLSDPKLARLIRRLLDQG